MIPTNQYQYFQPPPLFMFKYVVSFLIKFTRRLHIPVGDTYVSNLVKRMSRV